MQQRVDVLGRVEAKPLRRDAVVLSVAFRYRPLIKLAQNCRDPRQRITGKSAVWGERHDGHNEVLDFSVETSVAGKRPVVGSPLNYHNRPAARGARSPI